MYNKAQLSKDRRLAKEPKKLARPKDIDYVSMMGYRDDSPFKDRPYIDINTPDGTIDMSNTGIDLIANGRFLPKYSGLHQFDTPVVREEPIAEFGGTIMDLDEYQIEAYKAGGYIIEDLPQQDNGGVYSKDIQYPNKRNPANSFTVTDPRSMQYGGGYEIELTDEEIDQYRKGGYVVEELPKAILGGPEGETEGIPVTDDKIARRHGMPLKYFNVVLMPNGDYVGTPKKKEVVNTDAVVTTTPPQQNINLFAYTKTDNKPIENLKDVPVTANRSQTIMEPDPTKPGKFKFKEVRQVPYSTDQTNAGWEDMNTPRVLYYNPSTGQETEERFQDGGLAKAQLGLIKSPFKLPADVKYPMQVIPNKPTIKRTGRTYDALTDVKPAVAESTTPKNLPAKNKSIDEAMTLKVAERDATIKAVQEAPLLTEDQKNEILMSPQKLDEYSYLTRLQGPDTIKESIPYSARERAWDIATNPFDAFEYAVRTGDVSNMPRNYNQMRMAGIDPSAGGGANAVGNALNTTINLFDAGDKVVRNVNEGNYGTAALEAMRFIPGARLNTGASKYLTTQTPLKNAYKLNPKVLKENPEVLLHRVQKPGQTEQYILEQYGKQNPKLTSGQPGWGRAFSSDPSDMQYYTNSKIKKQRGYTEDPEILRLKLPKKDIEQYNIYNFNETQKAQGLGPYGFGSSKPTKEFVLPIQDIIKAEKFGPQDLDNLYKEYEAFNTPHWLRGYGKVPVELPGSPNTFTRSGLGGINMSNHTIKNVDYYTQLLNTYDKNIMPATNRKFYKDLIATVKKQDGLVTQRQLNELKRLATGNFDFGSKGYNKGYEGGGYVANQMTHFQDGGNMDPGNNALELHMFYDKNNFATGGTVEMMSDDEIKKYRDAGYVIIEESDYE